MKRQYTAEQQLAKQYQLNNNRILNSITEERPSQIQQTQAQTKLHVNSSGFMAYQKQSISQLPDQSDEISSDEQVNVNRMKMTQGRNRHINESDYDDDEVSLESEDVKSSKQSEMKFSDTLYKLIGKCTQKEVLLETKRQEYDMFCYTIGSHNQMKREREYVLSRKQLTNRIVTVQANPINTMGDKIVYIAK